MTMDSTTRAYIPLDEELPKDLFKKVTDFYGVIQAKLAEKGSEGVTVLSETITRHLPTIIFGSNYIERAGLNLEETIKICESIFRGEGVDAENIPERPRRRTSSAVAGRWSSMRWHYTISLRRMVVKDKPLSEDLIRCNHGILTEKVDTMGGMPWTDYSGQYRRIHVHAGNTNFVVPKFVPEKMRGLIAELGEGRPENRDEPYTGSVYYGREIL
ncbi:uncharacterized protein BP01DRAFT_409740 [Aspergillus saccharolyticus JOP 1030-1]|uniref:Uncharacterized protein n=1 Tax=Aspergillus saccharolyticus JOP 1030-1 TaxID=1450539 RepID=A0A318ZK13_9EURO|nr:hypothetical protein BP01DRAFT_409740 [Aspergillus saccharolyticus JOP 1030-1]PYH40598.1 hypothetical protein BP01DRAFT_409740 [Aspergillus saccharolyticus JOP 1030-1]